MAAQRFFEFIKPGVNIDFVGKRRGWIAFSVFLSIATVAMMLLNAYVIPGRGQLLNWSVEFKGGSEIQARFAKPVEPNEIRHALEAAGYKGVEAYKVYSAPGQDANEFMIRMGSISAITEEQAAKAEAALKAKKVGGEGQVQALEMSEGGDKAYVRLDRSVQIPVLTEALKAAGLAPAQVGAFGRTEDHRYEVTLVSLDSEVEKALESKLGADSVQIQSVSSVGAKAGAQLRNDGLKAVLGAIVLIVVYIAFRFDLRYGPGTIVALLHDALIVMGAFAVTYREFSLTTLAALLTIVGYSMNDTIVVFDRIRENAAKFRDRRFDRVVNQSINETLARTILTSGTSFFVTLAMNIFGTGVIRDFAFAMNVGIIVGTYSSIFIASPVLIWLNDKFVTSQKRAAGRPERQARRPIRAKEEEEPAGA